MLELPNFQAILITAYTLQRSLPGQQPDPVIESAQRGAAQCSAFLPDYVATRTAKRLIGKRRNGTQPPKWLDAWKEESIVTADINAKRGMEICSSVTIDGRGPSGSHSKGTWSYWKFASQMSMVLAPKRGARFSGENRQVAAKRTADCYHFSVSQEYSVWHTEFDGVPDLPPGNAFAAQEGTVYLYRKTPQPLRIDTWFFPESRVPLDSIQPLTELDFARLGASPYLLLKHFEPVACEGGRELHDRNETVLPNYDKFAVGSSIILGDVFR